MRVLIEDKGNMAKGKNIDPETKSKILKLAKQGYSSTVIASRFGVHARTVAMIIAKEKVT